MITTDEIRDHRARCRPHLVRLQLLVYGEQEPAAAAAEIDRATAAIIAEALAASRSALAGDGSRCHPGARTFLRVRLNRLTAAADEAIAAARFGDTAMLRRHLHRFEVMTSAIWTAQHAICDTSASSVNSG